MDGVLEGAVVLCACKLACSLLFLPSLAASYTSVSFCCCCLLIFTDFLVTVFLSALSVFESWQSELSPPGDVIALRSLLFLSHTYGAVLLLITCLIALEVLMRHLWPRVLALRQRSDGQRCVEGVNAREAEDGSVADQDFPQAVGFLCCLSVWIIVALSVRRRWKPEEAWAAACLDITGSLVRCLPKPLSPMPSAMNPCWCMAFLVLLVLVLTVGSGHKTTLGHSKNWTDFYQTSTETLAAERSKRTSDDALTLLHQHRDIVSSSSSCLLEQRAGWELKRTKRALSLTGEHARSQHASQFWWRLWGFPGLQENVMIGFLGLLTVFSLPFNLSVNILLIRNIDALLTWCFKPLLSSAANGSDSSTSQLVSHV